MQRRKHHRLLQILQHLIGNPLMPIQLRPRMHHPIPHRIHLRQPRPTHRLNHQPNRLHRRLSLYLLTSPA